MSDQRINYEAEVVGTEKVAELGFEPSQVRLQSLLSKAPKVTVEGGANYHNIFSLSSGVRILLGILS